MSAGRKTGLMSVGLIVALITAGVSVQQNITVEKQPDVVRKKQCYSESDVAFLMERTNSSRERTIEALDLSCAQATKSAE